MTTASVAGLLVALSLLAEPGKQSWGETVPPEAGAEFLPRSALVEVDGQVKGRGAITLELADPTRTFRLRVSAEGFETEEVQVEAGKVVDRTFFLALRPAGFERRVDPREANVMAQAANALWKAGRLDDAVDYAEQSLRAGNTPLANRVLGEVWRKRGDRDRAVRYLTMYLSLTNDPPDAPEIKAWLNQPRPGDIVIPAQ